MLSMKISDSTTVTLQTWPLRNGIALIGNLARYCGRRVMKVVLDSRKAQPRTSRREAKPETPNGRGAEKPPRRDQLGLKDPRLSIASWESAKVPRRAVAKTSGRKG